MTKADKHVQNFKLKKYGHSFSGLMKDCSAFFSLLVFDFYFVSCAFFVSEG